MTMPRQAGIRLTRFVAVSAIALGCSALAVEARAQSFSSTTPRVFALDERLLASLSPQVPIGSWKLSDVDETMWRGSSQVRGIPRRPGGPPYAFPGKRRASSNRYVQQALAGVAMGLAGFLAGGLTGAAVEGTSCACDDPGFQGFLIGGPVGATAGAILGVWLAR
jgi:hypothetical protein